MYNIHFQSLVAGAGASHLHRLTESCGAPVDWTPYYGDVVKYHDGDLRAAINTLERIPKTADAIQRFVIEDNDDWWDYIPENKWNELRKQMLTLLNSTGDRLAFMNNFHRSTRKHFDTDADTTFAVMSVYGDMMRYVYEWGGSDISFVEVLVARLKRKLVNEMTNWETEDEYGDIEEVEAQGFGASEAPAEKSILPNEVMSRISAYAERTGKSVVEATQEFYADIEKHYGCTEPSQEDEG